MAQIVAVHGTEATVQYLQRFEKEAYKHIKERMIRSAQPTVDAVKRGFPKQPWDSARGVNWARYGRTQRGRATRGDTSAKFPRYKQESVVKGVKADDGSRRMRRDGTYQILRIKQTNSAGSIYDLAKNTRTSGKESFVKNLNRSRRGKPNSRVMWPVVMKHQPVLEKNVRYILRHLEAKFSDKIALEGQRRLAASQRASAQPRNVLGQFGQFPRGLR